MSNRRQQIIDAMEWVRREFPTVSEAEMVRLAIASLDAPDSVPSTSVYLTSPHTRQPTYRVRRGDDPLSHTLVAWRNSERKGKPAFTVMKDATIAALVAERPTSLDALQGIPGLGEKRIKKYGEVLLRIIREQPGEPEMPPEEQKKRVILALKQRRLTDHEIFALPGVEYGALHRLVESGRVRQDREGKYFVAKVKKDS